MAVSKKTGKAILAAIMAIFGIVLTLSGIGSIIGIPVIILCGKFALKIMEE